MKTIRSLVLVSGEAESPARGAAAICERFVAELEQQGLAGEVAVKLVDDLGWPGAQPLVIIYPEAVVYAPITPNLVQRLVEEHLCQGRPVEALRAPAEAVAEHLPWLAAGRGAAGRAARADAPRGPHRP
jgi:NADP-reducing hydrogenase subunit HndC